MIDPDDIANGHKKPEGGDNKTNGCICSIFKIAVRDGFIKSPGERIPHTLTFSKKYFITHYDEIRGTHHFMYINHCPNCGKAIMKED